LCPDNPWPPYGTWIPTTYSPNQRLHPQDVTANDGNADKHIRISDVLTQHSRTIDIVDAVRRGTTGTTVDFPSQVVSHVGYWHLANNDPSGRADGGQGNIAMLDGHVDSMKISFATSTGVATYNLHPANYTFLFK
jgi:prepilin-type processing-associated H-X9-DG protein